MAKARLLEQWRVTRMHLGRARDLLPDIPIENLGDRKDRDLASLASFEELLEHNELELALDQLEGLGELNSAPGGFWRSLARAARLMGLAERAAGFEARSHTGRSRPVG